MRQKPLMRSLVATVRRPAVWFLLILFLFITFLEYTQLLRQTFLVNLGLTRYTIERILYLLPIIWAAFLLGWKSGIATSLFAMGSMLPRALFSSPNREDSLIEIFFVFVIGNLMSYSVGALRAEKERAAKLRFTQDELQILVHQITRAQEEERKRIARELHDDTIQSLVVLCQQIDYTIAKVKQLPPQARENLEELYKQTNKIMQEVRQLVQYLRPAVLDNLGLVSALEWLKLDVERYSGIPIDLNITGSEQRFPGEVELLLFRIAQEALRNVWKHAQASSARMILEFTDTKVKLSITDNGKGFSPPSEVSSLSRSGKLGLVGMQERARLLGGALLLKSEPGNGATVTIEYAL